MQRRNLRYAPLVGSTGSAGAIAVSFISLTPLLRSWKLRPDQLLQHAGRQGE
jgi:hypothetical protein